MSNIEMPVAKIEQDPKLAISEFLQRNMEHIKSADPGKVNNGDYGNSIILLLQISERSANAVVENFIEDILIANPDAGKEELDKIRQRIKTTIDNLLSSRTLREDNEGILRINI